MLYNIDVLQKYNEDVGVCMHVMFFAQCSHIDLFNLLIATGGLDRVLRFWNPYLTGKPIAVSQ